MRPKKKIDALFFKLDAAPPKAQWLALQNIFERGTTVSDNLFLMPRADVCASKSDQANSYDKFYCELSERLGFNVIAQIINCKQLLFLFFIYV